MLIAFDQKTPERRPGSGRLRIVTGAATAVITCCALAGCDRPVTATGERAPPAVTVAHPLVRSVIEWDEYPGRLEAVDFVELRARVSGMIVSMPFKEGALVDEGDLLVQIDTRPFLADLDAKVAAQDQAAARVELASIELRRIEAIPPDSRSPTEYDNAAAILAEAKAVLDGAKAQVVATRLHLEWCLVLAPISGRVGSRLVTVGNLVSGGAGQSTLLTTITSVDPIYCYIDADERSILKYAEMARAGERVSARQARIPTFLRLANETGFPHAGEVDFVDNRIDPMTGTIRGRGVFPNADGWLIPGLFTRVRVPGSGRYEAILVPDEAVQTDQNGKILMLVDAEGVVQPRPVELGALFGDLRAIRSGIGPEDRIIVNGLMNARPGMKVNAIEGRIESDVPDADMPPVNLPDPAAQPRSLVPTTGGTP